MRRAARHAAWGPANHWFAGPPVFGPALLALVLTAAALTTHAAPHYTFTPACAEAYATIIELRLAEGRDQLAAILRADPDNLVPVWLEDYADFFEVYIDEDETAFEEKERAYERRLDRIQAGPEDSPYHLYAQANMMLHWALARLKFGEYITTLRESRKAYKLLERNLERFPAFELSRKELGVLQAAVATVPGGYQWGLELVTGMDGDMAGGRRNLERVLAQQRRDGSPFLRETTALYAFLLLHLEREEEAAWARIRSAGFRESSLLGVFVTANVAMHTGRNDEALRVLSTRPHSPRYYPFPYLDFMHGVCLQRRLDPTAEVYLRSYVRRKPRGNFVKEAYQKLAWQQLLGGESGGYAALMAKVETEGNAVVGSDKTALREAEEGLRPNADLLRARLLFDGGYYARAATAIAQVDEATLTGEQRIELPYRSARIAHRRGRLGEAADRYKNTIALGRDAKPYYACKSAIELGVLAEARGEDDAARAYYEMALAMRPAEYGPGLHQQAKAGLGRL